MASRDAARRPAGCRALVLACALGIAGGASGQSKMNGDAARGEARAAACASCHGVAGRSPLPGTPALAGQQPEFLLLQMVLLREGLRDVAQMAGMLKGFSDRDLADIAAYYASQKPFVAGGAPNAARHARGATLAQAMGCGSCHRSDYRGQQQVPRIVDQREDYLVKAMKDYRENRRSGTDTSMNGVLYQVSDADIQALAHYLAQYPAR